MANNRPTSYVRCTDSCARDIGCVRVRNTKLGWMAKRGVDEDDDQWPPVCLLLVLVLVWLLIEESETRPKQIKSRYQIKGIGKEENGAAIFE